MAKITVSNGKVSATYKDENGNLSTEPLAYVRGNVTDSQGTLSVYQEATGANAEIPKAQYSEWILQTAQGLASLTNNTFNSCKITYDAKLEAGA